MAIPDASYTSSKGALISLTRDLACQWARYGVRVNALAPGFCPSESSAPMTEDEASQRYLRTGMHSHSSSWEKEAGFRAAGWHY